MPETNTGSQCQSYMLKYEVRGIVSCRGRFPCRECGAAYREGVVASVTTVATSPE